MWLKQHRKDLDLTQAELAERMNCAMITLQKFEASQSRLQKKCLSVVLKIIESARRNPDEATCFNRTSYL
jgi:transcriptional regulator with XRE-family HTH domain